MEIAKDTFRQFSIILLICAVIIFSGCGKKSPPEVVRETGTVTDVQGNTYTTVKIGDQWWMSENLKVKVYNDSSAIIEVKSTVPDSVWANKNTGAFCELDKRYGLHYNWYAINNSKKIAPAGWHIPSDTEWRMLEIELGMEEEESFKISWRGKEESEKLIPESSTGWPKNIVYGTNESGFSALPGGCRLFNGTRGEVTTAAYWWSLAEKNNSTAWYRTISTEHKEIFRYYVDKNYGLNIRCVKD